MFLRVPSKNVQKPGSRRYPGFLLFLLVVSAIILITHLLTHTYAQTGLQVFYPAQSLPLVSQEITNRINGVRIRHLLPFLARDVRMDLMAERRATDMIRNDYFGHVSPAGLDLEALAQASGIRYRTVGEILWEGAGIEPGQAAAAAVQSWMDSASHREEILYRDYDAVGVSVFRVDDRILAAVEFVAYR